MAIAPEQTGIGIHRQFTTAGQDPYDTVVWERRHAKISHYATGAVAFEQRGVEVPAGWSLNATNILAQKYFRGTLGTAEREWSLRQVADRVVDTITGWGRRGGYFVDEEEARTFSDELKYLIIHQKAAFNSPVWFNIGVKGVPQQGSACFILSVDDSMDSILEWYKEEGTIFKGGSGAGVNLSRIRSSRERLRGGGTASGPVSFMRGADASAGTIKCLDGDTPIVTTEGVVPIRAVTAGSSVLTRSGPRPVTDVHDNGVRPLVRVRTSIGEEIRCTAEHRFWARTAAGEGWQEAGGLKAGDGVLVDVSGIDVGRPQPLVGVSPGHHNERARTLPTVIDEPFALWLGWLWGDGSITTGPSANFISMQLGDKDPEVFERYQSLCASLFGDVNVFESRDADRPDASASVRFCSTQIIRFLERNGLRKGRAATLAIPASVQSSPAPVRAAFLAGLFEANGHVAHGYVGFSSVSQALARDVQRLLLSLSVPSHRSVHDRVAAYGTAPVHTVRVIGGEGQRRFAKLVGLVSERKTRRLEEAMMARALSPFETEWVLPHAETEIDELWQRGDSRLRRALAPYSRYGAPRSLSLLRARALLDRFPGELEGTRLERFCSGDELWTTVTVEADGQAPTFDLTVEGVHEYLVHNVVTHNSGGKTRRAAKMVILDVDHPDIEDFIWCKAIEERKARALRDAGFDMDLDGKDSHSIQYQNANNSVRVTDAFMNAVVDDGDWDLLSVTTGEPVETVRARDLFRQMAKATWECADPGMQFDTTINRWHTAPVSGRINASNPCFTGDSLVHTDKGLIAFKELFDRANQGETFAVWTHDATSPDHPAERVELTTPEAFMITGYNDIVRLRFDNGMEVRCTPGHRIFTLNRGYVAAEELTAEDRVKVLDLPAPAVSAERRLPLPADIAEHRQGDRLSLSPVNLPEKWTPELGHYLGWLVGDGCVAASGTISAAYGSPEDRAAILPRHSELVTWLNGGVTPKPSVQANGTIQQRLSRRSLTRLFTALGLTPSRGPAKRVPASVLQAPSEIVGTFLQGLFDADGCVRRSEATGSYVGLGSASRQLLVDIQRLLATLGVTGRIYATARARPGTFTYTRVDGTEVTYNTSAMYDLRITGASIPAFAEAVGFSLPSKAQKLSSLIDSRVGGFHRREPRVRLVERVEDGYERTYNLTEPRNHSYVVNGLIVRNCSEYMHVDNSACNLASLNLLTFLDRNGAFDVDGFKAATEVVFTAQEILVGNADYPTEAIAENSRRFRQLGIGYANLGALLMAQGLAYDSDGGRSWAGAITSLLTGHAYTTSARTAARMGPFSAFTENREATLNVLRMHRDSAAHIDEELVPPELLSAAQRSWDDAVEIAEEYGVRNAQASVLAPTGCLTGGSLVATERGLVRLGSLGDSEGPQWQDLDTRVATDDGARQANRFFVNGLDSVVTVGTTRGYRIQGTPQHRIKVVDPTTGAWEWRRFADIGSGDLVPLALDQLVGAPVEVLLPPLPEAYWTGEHHARAPRRMTSELAELVGYFMGDGSLHSRGLRLCVAAGDLDVVERLRHLGKELFGLEAHVTPKRGYAEVRFDAVRLTLWWEACGFAKRPPADGHVGKGFVAHVPDAVLHANDPAVYGAFIRGLYEADGDVGAGYPTLKNTSLQMVRDVQTMLLALRYPARLSVAERHSGWGTPPVAGLRLLNRSYSERWRDQIGFISGRKNAAIEITDGAQAGRRDYIPFTRELIDRLAPTNDRLRRVLLLEHARGRVSRRLATELYQRSGDPELGHLLSFFYDRIAGTGLAGEEFTYDISVPDNLTYLANGFISHNTIGLLMDCDTTGIEPDLGLVKMKKLVGGGTMSIVNQTVPRALTSLGYDDAQVEEIIAYIDEHKSILGAPHLAPEHLKVFACSMGDNAIHYRGHVRMMAAVQPFISGAISKTVNMPEEASVEEVERLHIEAWQMGLKAVAIYRDNCKVAQPLAMAKRAASDPALSGAEVHDAELAVKVAELERALAKQTTVVVKQPVRERMPRRRRSSTFAFRVADCEGFVTVGEYEDGRPGEVFMKVAKQGSTLAGIMDAFAISVSLGLQHGVPLATYVKKYTSMRFEPAGMTDDPDLRIAQSLVDYIFRRLAVDYLSYPERLELGVLTSQERTQPTLPGIDESVPNRSIVEVEPHRELEAGTVQPTVIDAAPGAGPVTGAGPVVPPAHTVVPEAADAPYCYECGVQMQRAGSCHACPSCGTTSGCS